jgi:outer membrane biosynthesis protein TonB
VNLTQQQDKNLYQLKSANPTQNISRDVFGKGRYLVGRSDSCDIYVDDEAVSAVHAVLEITDRVVKIYDMNSTNGTYVNGEKIIVKEIKPGDKLGIANVDFVFKNYEKETALPPVLESLTAVPELPKTSPVTSKEKNDAVYPLATDPRAEFSEYIFEDIETLYPIFKYDVGKVAVEVIMLFKGSVFSIDYLPEGKQIYELVGESHSDLHIELPCLGKTEKIPFIEVSGHTSLVHSLPSYEALILSDKKNENKKQTTIELNRSDIIRFSKGDIQIFVRASDAPPKVAAAPLFRRDKAFQSLLILLFLFISFFSVAIQFVSFEEIKKIEEEKAPERMAAILYKQKLTTSTFKTVEKTENAPKVQQKAPDKVAVKKEVPKEVQPDVKKPDIADVKNPVQKPDPGEKSAQEKKVVLKGNPKAQPTPKQAQAPKGNPNKTQTNARPSAYSKVESKNSGPVDVYKSMDFSSSVNSVLAKGGSLSGVKSDVYGASGSSIGSGAISGAAGTGDLKKAEVGSNFGSLTGSTTGVIGTSKGAEGLSSKKAIYTAGIPSETVVLGSMDPDVIRRLLMAHLTQFRSCYQNELDRTGNDQVQGAIKLLFTIGASGRVDRAGVESDSALPGGVKGCVVNVLRGIQFPEPQGGGTVEVNQQMNFYPKKI